jgi:hypothetical protein
LDDKTCNTERSDEIGHLARALDVFRNNALEKATLYQRP